MNDITDISLAQRSLEIFDHAILLPEKQRSKYLLEQCGDDEILYKKCLSLLESYHTDNEFFKQISNVQTNEETNDLIGKTIGKYRLDKKLGYGGMADVYSATRVDGVHNRSVALKLVRGWGDTRELIARFSRERKILANLKHPSIAHFLDGGISDDGRPYYTMELVEGKHIDQYCQQNKLSIEARLQLFLKVCAAVAGAHQQLVIHRDLKPSNILVTQQGEVKLLDFGIAKLLENDKLESNRDETDLSVLCNPMTPRYCSPEQIKREALGTASDQYSLGVLLYELLCGRSPYNLNHGNLQKNICNTDPRPPSQAALPGNLEKNTVVDKKWSRQLKGDLDTIVLKALQKTPQKRYLSVQKLAEDIERYLSRRPIIARKDTFFYNSTRFAQRNWKSVSLATITILILLAQQYRLISERDIAQENEKIALEKGELATQVQAFLISLFNISDPGETRGNTITAREILDRGVENIDGHLANQPQVKAALLDTMGVAYKKLGLYETSLPLIERALTLREKNIAYGSEDIADSLNSYGDLLNKKGQYDLAAKMHHRALALLLDTLDQTHPKVGDTYSNLGKVYDNKGKHDKAKEYLLQSVHIYKSNAGNFQNELADSYNNLGLVSWKKGDYSQAITHHEKALQLRRKNLASDHYRIASSLHNLGIVYYEKGKFDDAIDYYKQALKIKLNSFGQHHPSVGRTYNSIGLAYSYKGDNSLAVHFHEKALAIRLKSLGETHPEVSSSYNNLGIAYKDMGKYDLAMEYHNKALANRLIKLGSNHPTVASSYYNLGSVYKEIGEYDLAIKHYEKTLEIELASLGSDHPEVATSYNALGTAHREKGEYDVAIKYYEKALAIGLKSLGKEHPTVASSYRKIGKALNKKGEYDQAIPYIEKSLSISTLALGDEHPSVADSYIALGEAYTHKNSYSDALGYYEKAYDIRFKKYGQHHPKSVATERSITEIKQLLPRYTHTN